MRWIKQLQTRWKVGTAGQVVIILIVFACTGMTVYLVKTPILKWLFGEIIPLEARILYYVLILPIYNLLLLCYGFLFGQFQFFWNFEKRFFGRLSSLFKRKGNSENK